MFLKKLAMLSVVCTLLLSAKGIGNGYYGSCCQDSCFSGWSVYGDWLYWTVRRCGLDYVLPLASGRVTTDVFSVDPSYNSGYRLGIAKTRGCLYFDAFYTHFSNEDSDRADNLSSSEVATRLSFIRGSMGEIQDVDRASGRYELNYDVVDIVGGLTKNPCYGLQTYYFGGFKYARIDQKYKTQYLAADINSPFLICQKNNMDAYGLNIGLAGEYDLFNCFKAFGRFSYDLLLGDFKRETQQPYTLRSSVSQVAVIGVDVRDECWRMISVLNLAVGISSEYQLCCSCLDHLVFAVGYEFHKWLDMPDFYGFGTAEFVERTPLGFGLDGVTVRLAIHF